jgi:hypothetical protein
MGHFYLGINRFLSRANVHSLHIPKGTTLDVKQEIYIYLHLFMARYQFPGVPHSSRGKGKRVLTLRPSSA